jgi:type II secretory pathway pseudopilin PulG
MTTKGCEADLLEEPMRIVSGIWYLVSSKKNSNQFGFTLIELILYVSIVSIILMALIPFAWNIIGGSAKSGAQQEVFSQGRNVSERIKYEIRNANSITSVAATSIDLNTATNTVTVIDLSGGKMRIRYGAGGTAVNLNSNDTVITCPSNICFTNYTTGDNKSKNIRYTFIVDDNFGSARQEYNVPAMTMEGSAEVRSN